MFYEGVGWVDDGALDQKKKSPDKVLMVTTWL